VTFIADLISLFFDTSSSPAKRVDHSPVPSAIGRGTNIVAQVRAVIRLRFHTIASKMGWIQARCLIINLIHFGMEMCFIGTSVEPIFVAAVRV